MNDERRRLLAAQLESAYPDMSVAQIVLDIMGSAANLWEHADQAGQYDAETAMVIARAAVVALSGKLNAATIDALCRRN
jgi:hypothetical protein